MYFMDSKTFLNTYIKEDPDLILAANYVLVSSKIRKSGRYENQVINANSILYPTAELIMDYSDYKHDEEYIFGYRMQLDDAEAFLATLIKASIEEGYTIIFLCTPKEKKYNYFKILKEYIDDFFEGFPFYDYKKLKNGKISEKSYDPERVLEKCNQIIKHAKKSQKDKALSSDKGREKYIKKMSKDEMKKELKKRGLYHKSLDKSEMRDILETFI